jgi:hypothetical protein
MITKISELNVKDLRTVKKIIMDSAEEIHWSMNNIIKDCYIIKHNKNIVIVDIEPAIFDNNSMIIYIITCNCQNISSIVELLRERYSNIYLSINEAVYIESLEDLLRTKNMDNINKNTINYPIDTYLCDKQENVTKPLEHFLKCNIPCFDYSKLNYYKFNENEFDEFVRINYLDKYHTVSWRTNGNYNLLGLTYTSFDGPRHNNNFLVSTLPNDRHKETIVGIIKYNPNYQNMTSYPVTYVSYVETNHFYQRKGVYKNMVNLLIENIPLNQHLITSMESDVGKIVGTHKIIESAVKSKGLPIEVIKYEDFLYGNVKKLCK